MAAGLGFKDFTTGEVLTAADVDGYLMQGVWVFADATARDAAVTSPQEGNFAYLKDTNVTTYYTGSAWANLDTTGMTNPMTTTGDTIYSSSGSTPARLGIGSTGQVLTVAGGVPAWTTPAAPASGMTKITSGTFTTAATVDIDNVFSTSYSTYFAFISTLGSDPSSDLLLQYRYAGPTTETGASYYYSFGRSDASQTASQHGASAQTSCVINLNSGSSTRESKMALWFNGVGQAAADEPVYQGTSWDGYNTQAIGYIGGFTITDRIYTGLRLLPSTGTITGNYAIYGLAI